MSGSRGHDPPARGSPVWMPSIDHDGLAPAEVRALQSILARDPALARELEMILPALAPAARRAFGRELGRCGDAERPAAAVLEALVVASRAAG
jgi:hypothetical protein